MITIKVETKDGAREFKVNSDTLPVADRISELLGNCEYIECQGCEIWSPVDYGQSCPCCGAAMHD